MNISWSLPTLWYQLNVKNEVRCGGTSGGHICKKETMSFKIRLTALQNQLDRKLSFCICIPCYAITKVP